MILQLDKKEMASLTLHMSLMRKSVRKGFKSNYGSEAKGILESYDEVKSTVAQELEKDVEQTILHFNIKEIDMLHSFLIFYIKELHKFEVEKLNEVDLEQIQSLESIKEKVEECKAA